MSDEEEKDDRELTPEERDRYAAEAEKFRAEAKKLEIEAKLAEQRQKAELLHAATLQRMVDDEAYIRNLSRLQAERTWQIEQSKDVYHHIYRFNSVVGESSVKNCMDNLLLWHRTEPGCDIEIIFSSPGGSVIDGLVLFDFIGELRDHGHRVTTSTYGMAASMAGILLQAGDKRIMHKEAWLLIHEISFGTGGSMGTVEDTVEWLKGIQDRILDIFAARCAQAKKNGTATKPLTKGQLEKGWRRKDWWISSDNALTLGLVDEVRGGVFN